MSDQNYFGKSPEPDDPLSMHAESAPGDPSVMLEGIIEEYARIGWDAPRIRRLFEDPFFQATYGLRGFISRDALHERIDAVLARCGVFQVTITTAPETEDRTFVATDRLRRKGDQ